MNPIARLVVLALAVSAPWAAGQSPDAVPTVVVTADGQPRPIGAVGPSLAYLGAEALAELNAIHPAEIRLGAPGLWVSRGNGQEHLMAIRSPVLTGAGSCGAFLYLENGVPIRPASFCNVNQLTELNVEQADAVELLRGPGPVLYGSNALHGVFHARAAADERFALGLTAGGHGYLRASADIGARRGDRALRVRLLGAHDGGYRADSGYGLGKLNVDAETAIEGTRIAAAFAATLLNQETAGFVRGLDAYAQRDVARSNPNPEAYRDLDSQRLSVRIERPDGTVWLPYVRRSSMEFLQHFLPGQPTEFNGHRSAGLKVFRHWALASGGLHAGADLDLARIRLREVQAGPVTGGSAFLTATRPAGVHYDFSVDALNAAAFVQRSIELADGTELAGGVRAEYTGLDYTTRRAPGDLDDDGNACGFGGCLFSRPADRRDHFLTLAPKLSLSRALSPAWRGFASLSRGFRAPQATELYRLQSGQSVADLDPEIADGLDLGVRGDGARWRLDAALFALRKRHVILRDADGFNVNGGRTEHVGIELDAAWRATERIEVALSATLARHRYGFTRAAGGGERIEDGADVDTAPRSIGALRVTWQPREAVRAWLEWEHMGHYWLDAANEHRYGGHDLLHAAVQVSRGPLGVSLHLRNVLDEAYAERADYAFGSYRYFPGQSRNARLSVTWRR